jgi:urease accessory protein
MTMTKRQQWITVVAAACVAVIGTASPALAHTGHGSSGLWTGVTHPMLGIDHVVAMITVGVLAAALMRSFALPATFVGTMAVGGALGIAGLPMPGGELAIAISVAALGAALVFAKALRMDLMLGSIAVAGFVHGHAHGVEAPTVAHPLIYVTGFVLATAALHATGVVVGMQVRRYPSVRGVLGALAMGAGIGMVAGVI